jgi:hypothetical protein
MPGTNVNLSSFIIIKPRQSNHESYILPGNIVCHGEKYLYRNVALWGYLQSRYICCTDVAENFGISVRQATHVISAIHRKYSDTIHFKLDKRRENKRVPSKTYILITGIKNGGAHQSQS